MRLAIKDAPNKEAIVDTSSDNDDGDDVMGTTMQERASKVVVDSGVSLSSASSTASSAKQSLTNEFIGVRAFCIIFSRNTYSK